MIKLVKFVLYWAPRLPWQFTVSFLVLMIGWFMLLGAVTIFGLETMSAVVAKAHGFPYLIVAMLVFFVGFGVVLLLGLGLLASYNISAWLQRTLRGSPKVTVLDSATPTPGLGRQMQEFKQQRNLNEDPYIGIILAGGGAKGAYQAGAMKAIYEFLEANNALDKVRMIAGTSIGSWNAMFWLAGLVKSPRPNQPSTHELWWRNIRMERIMEFAPYLPFANNSFFKTTPWQEAFEEIFMKTPSVRQSLEKVFYEPGGSGSGISPVHFYFTRSNVERGHLVFATNRISLPMRTRPNWRTADPDDREPLVPRDRYKLIEKKEGEDPVRQLKEAVFASMDLPPLFPYMKIRDRRDEWFEDGGVVDNLPLWFSTEIEECNLLFVLPLNASFDEKATQNSVIRRLFRVMDIRQGVLERNSMKLAHLYNDRTRLVRELAARQLGAAEGTGSSTRANDPSPPAKNFRLTFSRSRVNDLVSVFAICPQQPLEIGTTEFWKPTEAGKAFDLMYAATKSELEDNFLRATDPNWLRMALVNPQGGKTYLDEF